MCCVLNGFLKILLMVNFSFNADGYDPLDPNGNITITWDIRLQHDDSQEVSLPQPHLSMSMIIRFPMESMEWEILNNIYIITC